MRPAGGLVRFGVPEFKIEKRLIERRLAQLDAEGVELRYGVEVGVDVSADELRATHDAVVVATGSRVPRDLPVEGRELGRRALRDGVPLRARAGDRGRGRHGGRARAACARAADHRGREARDRDRRRRHGRRLRCERAPRAGRLGDPDRGARRAAREAPRRSHAVAALADEAPHLVRAEGGRRAGLRDLDDTSLRLGRQGRADPLGAERRRAAVRRDPRDGGVAPGGARAARDGLPPSRAVAARAARRRARRPRQRRRAGLRDVGGRRLRGR